MTRRRRIDETCAWCKAPPGKACFVPQWPAYEMRNPHLVGDPGDEGVEECAPKREAAGPAA